MPIHYRQATPADTHCITDVNVRTWQTAYRDILPAEFLASRSIPDRVAPTEEFLHHLGPDHVFFVPEENPGEVVGYASGGPAREPNLTPGFDGELYTIYILEEYQRQGIGQHLLYITAYHLFSRGYVSLVLWALHDNPHTAFYLKFGGTKSFEKNRAFGPHLRPEVAFGWPDIKSILELLSNGDEM